MGSLIKSLAGLFKGVKRPWQVRACGSWRWRGTGVAKKREEPTRRAPLRASSPPLSRR
jgi:hypothetical protein